LTGLPAFAWAANRTFTAEQWAALTMPACPVCGATVRVDRIDVTANEADLAAGGRTYMAGLWECPHGCDPVAMTRRHYGQSARTSPAFDGIELSCTCGDTTAAGTAAEAAAWLDAHLPPDGQRHITLTSP